MDNLRGQNGDGPSKEQKDEKNKKVNVDTILVEELGQFGLYQARAMVFLVIAGLFGGCAAAEYIFTAARIPTRCLIPECDQDPPQWFPPWVESAIPAAAGGFDNCQRFAATNLTVSDTCSIEQFNQDELVPCLEYLYENTDTVVYDFNLACDEWRRTFIGSFRTFGTLLALPITGFISDRWGRRTALCIAAFNTAWLGILRLFASTYVGFIISELVESIFGSGMMSTSYILATEIVGPDYRVIAGSLVTTFFSLGQIVAAFMSWLLPNWKTLTIALYAPQFIVIFYYFFLNESFRWYVSKGRYEETEAVLKTISKVNKKKISDKTFEALKESSEEAKMQQALLKEELKLEPWLPVLVFRNKPILLRCFVLPFCWITLTLVYYGMSINSVNLSGSSHFNFMAVTAIEIPGFWMGVFLMKSIGRKSSLIGSYWICAACQIAFMFIPSELTGVSLFVFLMGKFSISAVATTIYAYAAELFPTRYRHSLFAFSSMVGRVGSVLAPLTPALSETVWIDLPNVLFACCAFVAGALVFMTPETRGTRLPDTMEEACKIGKNKSDTSNVNKL